MSLKHIEDLSRIQYFDSCINLHNNYPMGVMSQFLTKDLQCFLDSSYVKGAKLKIQAHVTDERTKYVVGKYNLYSRNPTYIFICYEI